jgi:hypothetical protein
MNKIALFILLGFTILSCSKSEKSLRQLEGEWEMTSYRETLPSGLTKQYNLDTGYAYFKRTKGEKQGSMNLGWKAFATDDTSTFEMDGTFEQISENDLKMAYSGNVVDFHISRQLKKDMQCEIKFDSGRYCILIFKKKT